MTTTVHGLSKTLPNVVIYGRLSENPNDKKSVERQMSDARERATRDGWHVAAEFSDDGISAFKGKTRPGYDALMTYVDEQGDALHAVVVFQLSRLWRRAAERQPAARLLSDRRMQIVCTSGTSIDFSTAVGRLLVEVLGWVDEMESQNKSERIKRVADERRDAGKASSVCAFGWRRVDVLNERGARVDWADVVDERAAAVVREIVARLDAGESRIVLAREFNTRLVPTPRESSRLMPSDAWQGAGRWHAKTVSDVATRPANVGRRVHEGADWVAAAAPAIIDDVAAYHRLVARYLDPQRVSLLGAERPTARKHLLSCSTWVTCGDCGGQMASRTGYKDRRVYFCQRCQKMQRLAEPLEQHVAALAIAYLDDDANRMHLLSDSEHDVSVDSLLAELSELEQQQAAMGEAAATQRVSVAALIAFEATVQPRVDELREQIKSRARRRGSAHIECHTDESWAALTIEQQRRLLVAMGCRVVVNRSTRGPGYKPQYVDIQFGVDAD